MASSLNTQLASHDRSEDNELLTQSGRAKNTDNGKKQTVDLPSLIAKSQEGWYERLGNIGGGNEKFDKEGNAQSSSTLDRIGTLLSGGVLGSYGFSRRDAVNKEIDDMAKLHTKTAFDSTLKLTDIFAKSSDKINFLATKVETCASLETDLANLMEKNKESIRLFENMRKAINPGVIGTMREGVANAWEKTKNYTSDNPGKGVLGMAGAGLGAAAIGAGVISTPYIALPVATAAVMTAAYGAYQTIGDKKNLQASKKALEEMQRTVVAIRTQTEAERDALLAKISAKYAPEAQVEKNMRELIVLRCKDKPDLIRQFEEALQNTNPEQVRIALEDLMKEFKKEGNEIFTNALELDHIDRYFKTLGNARSMNFRANVNQLMGSEPAKGQSGVIRFIKNLKRIGALTGVRGKKVEFADEVRGVVSYTITDVTTDGGGDVLILRQDDGGKNGKKIALTTKGDKVEIQTPVVHFGKIYAALDELSRLPAEKIAKIKTLIQNGMGRFLDAAEYKRIAEIVKGLNPKPKNIEVLEDPELAKKPITITPFTDQNTLALAV